MRDAFHHAAITHEDIGIVVYDVMTRTVELRGQGALSDSKTDRISDALPQRTGGGFNAGGVAIFRMTWSF